MSDLKKFAIWLMDLGVIALIPLLFYQVIIRDQNSAIITLLCIISASIQSIKLRMP